MHQPLFIRNTSPNLRIILAITLALILIIIDTRYQYLNLFRSGLSILVYPLQYTATQPLQLINILKEQLTSSDNLRVENSKLYHENLLLKARLQKFESLESENSRLRDLLGSSRAIGAKVLIAEILTIDLAPYRQQVMINKGSHSGVYIGQPVLDANAVMGQVIQITPFSAIVLLITDADHELPVVDNRNGLRTIAAGTGLSQELELRYLPKNADIQINDLLITSGLDGRFPAGYPVGRVTQIRQDPANLFAAVLAKPSARLDRNREVLLVWSLDTAETKNIKH